MTSLGQRMEARLREAGTPERAASEKAYLKSDLEFLGATVWQTRAATRELAPRLDHDALVREVSELWSAPIFERRMAATFLLEREASQLGVGDLPLIERLIRESGTWALVDNLAGDVLGRLVDADPAGMTPAMDRWARDADFWVRRASLLAELGPIRRGAAIDRFVARAEAMLEEKEFFIRKAIGWVLREAGKRQPAEVVAWLEPRVYRASGVTMREAVKYLPEADAARLMAAYRGR
ncbi:MAG TPA: DNA alkylation repair protein [Candidatus Limnocylindria bacterium]|nr:DNA alkylation repair protein [Candidatus Limnocylindria bacterium]